MPNLAREPNATAYIALLDDVVTGTLSIRHEAGSPADVSRLFVRPRHRRRGIARALLAQARADTREHGSVLLRAITMSGMSEGIVALNAAGFTEVNPFTEVPVAWQPVVFLSTPNA